MPIGFALLFRPFYFFAHQYTRPTVTDAKEKSKNRTKNVGIGHLNNGR